MSRLHFQLINAGVGAFITGLKPIETFLEALHCKSGRVIDTQISHSQSQQQFAKISGPNSQTFGHIQGGSLDVMMTSMWLC